DHSGRRHLGGDGPHSVARLAVHSESSRGVSRHHGPNLGARPQEPVKTMTDMTSTTQTPGMNHHLLRFLRENYIYLILVVVVALLSMANLDKFALFERGNFLNQNNIIN